MLLQTVQLTKHFGGLAAVSDVDINVEEGEMVGLGPWKFVKYVPGEYVHLVANEKYWKFPDRFYQGLSVSDIQQSAEITSLKKQLEEAVLAGEVAAETIGELGAQLTSLEESTRQLLEASADDTLLMAQQRLCLPLSSD